MHTKTLSNLSLIFCLSACFISFAHGQCADGSATCPAGVPRMVKFGGVLKDGAGKPHTGIVGITFAIYAESSGGAPLWQETQNVQLDQQGRYAVFLGASTPQGLPQELFASAEPRWLSVQAQLPEEGERPRALLVSVPYALQAANAQTLGGLPPSAFVRAAPTSSSQRAIVADAAAGASSQTIVTTATVSPASGNAQVPAPTAAVNSSVPNATARATAKPTPNVLYADQFSGGVADAISACPSAGCIIYADSQNVNRNLGTIDPGSKAITLYLGPFTYNVKQITLERDLRIIGMGSGITFLQSVNGNNPVVVSPQATFSAATNVFLSGFRLVGSTGNTSEDAIFWNSTGLAGSGVWYSELRDVEITGFAGNGIHLRGTDTDYSGMSQFIQFNQVVVWRVKGGGNGLRVEGAAYELSFNDCQFDGTAPGDGTNILLGALPTSPYAVPTDISFTKLTTQLAATAVQIDGGWGLSFYSPHHEFVWGVYALTGNTGASIRGVTISDAGFQTSGVNGGAGYLLKVTSPGATGIQFVHNHIMGAVDAVVASSSGASISYQDNEFYGGTSLPNTSGITAQLTPNSSIAIGGAHTVGLTSSTAIISTIQSSLGAGETATFFTLNGPVRFGSGGNINLLGAKVVTINGSITFVVSDLGHTPSWIPISQWRALPQISFPPSPSLPGNTPPH
jgi:hypothetical protein